MFIDASAPSQGVPESFSSYLVSLANAGNAVGRLASGILADQFGMSSPLTLPLLRLSHPISQSSRADQRHDACDTRCGRVGPRMAVHTRNSGACHVRCDLWRIVWLDIDSPRRTDDGARRERRCRTALHHRLTRRTCGPADIWCD
jgi:hypothetical protein